VNDCCLTPNKQFFCNINSVPTWKLKYVYWILILVGNDWRYQRSNVNPLIEQTTDRQSNWPREKRKKQKTNNIIISSKYNLFSSWYCRNIVYLALNKNRSLIIFTSCMKIKKSIAQPQVIKFTCCLPMLGGSLRFLPPLKLATMI
jgi:hypothetical protein